MEQEPKGRMGRRISISQFRRAITRLRSDAAPFAKVRAAFSGCCRDGEGEGWAPRCRCTPFFPHKGQVRQRITHLVVPIGLPRRSGPALSSRSLSIRTHRTPRWPRRRDATLTRRGGHCPAMGHPGCGYHVDTLARRVLFLVSRPPALPTRGG
jgi:hypothetical protein